MDADFDKDGWATSKAIVLSKAMRKITQINCSSKSMFNFTNQLRQKLGVMFGDPWTTSGGKALTFPCFDSYSIKEYGTNKRYQKRYNWY